MILKDVFSARDSYLSVDNCENGFKVSTIRRWNRGVFEIFRVTYEKKPDISFTPWEMSIKNENGVHNACLFGTDGICFMGKGVGMTLEYCEYTDRYIANYAIKENGSTLL